MNNVSFITYTHSNCADLWRPYTDSLEEYAPGIKNYFLSDLESTDHPNHKFYIYDESIGYGEEFARILESINEEYVIYMQEDFILFDKIDKHKIYDYLDFLKANQNFSFIRLLKCGDVTSKAVCPGLFMVSDPAFGHNSINSYSMQPTIWRKKDLISLYKKTKQLKFGESWAYTNAMNSLKINGLYHYADERRRGLSHYDSSVFPYIATAIVKGKWNLSEYPNELDKIFKKYNIDPKLRGII